MRSGFNVEVRDLLHRGENWFAAKVSDSGGRYGFRMRTSGRDPVSGILGAIILISLCLAAWNGLKYYKFDSSIALVLVVSLGVQLIYLWNTEFDARTYDVEGHLQHASMVYQGTLIPQAAAGWECYHPPLYYGLAAVILGATQLGNGEGIAWLQFFSLTLSFFFLCVSSRIIGTIFKTSRHKTVLALVLLAFWPSGFIHAPRIGNDALLYLLFALSLHNLLLWVGNFSSRNSLLAASLCGARFAYESEWRFAGHLCRLEPGPHA